MPKEIIEVIEGEYRILDDPTKEQLPPQASRPPAEASEPQSPATSTKGAPELILDTQKEAILKLANGAFGWTEEDLSREKLNGGSIDKLPRHRALDLIVHLQELEAQGKNEEMGQNGAEDEPDTQGSF